MNNREMGSAEYLRTSIVAFLTANGPHEGTKSALYYAMGIEHEFSASSFYSALRQLEARDVVETVIGERGMYKRIQLRSTLQGVTTQLDDTGYEQLVVYVQNLKDENEKLKMEVKALRRMFGQMMDMFGR